MKKQLSIFFSKTIEGISSFFKNVFKSDDLLGEEETTTHPFSLPMDMKLDAVCEKVKSHARMDGENSILFKEGYTAYVKQFEATEIEKVTTEVNQTQKAIDIRQAEKSSFIVDTRSAELTKEYTPEKQTEQIKLQAERDEVEYLHHHARLEHEAAILHFNNVVRQYGIQSHNKLLLDGFNYFAITSGVFDFVVTSGAFIGMGTSPLGAYTASGAISFGLAWLGDALGEAIIRDEKAKKLLAIGGIGLQVCLAGFRGVFTEFDAPLLVTTGIIASLYVGGIMVGRKRTFRKVYFEAEQAVSKTKEEVTSLTKELGRIDETLNNVDEYYDNKAFTEAIDERDNRDIILGGLEVSMANLNTKKDTISTLCAEQITKGIAKIGVIFDEGQRHSYKPSKRDKGNRGKGDGLKSAIITFFLLIAMGCNPSQANEPGMFETQIHEINVHVDKSGSMSSEMVAEKDRLKIFIYNELTQLNKTFSGQRAIRVNFYIIGQNSLPSKTSISLPLGDVYILRNVPERQKLLRKFKDELIKAIDQVFTEEKEPITRLHRSVAYGLNQLASSNATRKSCIVITDAIQEGIGDQVNLSKPKYSENPKQVQVDQQVLIERLIKDYPLDDLDGIQVYFICQNQSAYDSDECRKSGKHTNECRNSNDELSFYASRLFKALWEGYGAQVDLSRNL